MSDRVDQENVKQKEYVWCAIGDSFTYLNDHLDETGCRVKKGYLTRTKEKLQFPVRIINRGINGSATEDWLEQEIPEAGFYTILLGTNDWYSRKTPVGTAEDYEEKRSGTILGNLGCLIKKIRSVSKTAPVIVMNPVERGDFTNVLEPDQEAHGSYREENGVLLREAAEAIFKTVRGEEIYPVDLHSLAGFKVENVVRFKRLIVDGKEKDVPYPEYTKFNYHPKTDPYPYPVEAAGLTYDGLHPSDEGAEKIAAVLAEVLNRVIMSCE